MHSLEIQRLKKSYNGRPVLEDISLTISSGEVVGLLGPNGAGKTTTFYIILGLLRPDSGDILLDGENLNRLPMYRRARKGIGYLPQEASIFRKLTVRENIMAVLELLDIDEETRKRRLEGILEELNIKKISERLGYQLSGGERRKVEIARALAVNPIFILLDEPFAGIDPLAVNDLKQTLKALAQKGIGLIITDHNVRETLSITDRAYIINDGRILAHGTPADLISNELVKKNYLGEGFTL
jgi:lipopolysaccharide export system ATP-binding protein